MPNKTAFSIENRRIETPEAENSKVRGAKVELVSCPRRLDTRNRRKENRNLVFHFK